MEKLSTDKVLIACVVAFLSGFFSPEVGVYVTNVLNRVVQ